MHCRQISWNWPFCQLPVITEEKCRGHKKRTLWCLYRGQKKFLVYISSEGPRKRELTLQGRKGSQDLWSCINLFFFNLKYQKTLLWRWLSIPLLWSTISSLSFSFSIESTSLTSFSGLCLVKSFCPCLGNGELEKVHNQARILEQGCLMGLSLMIEMFYTCFVQYGSHWPINCRKFWKRWEY